MQNSLNAKTSALIPFDGASLDSSLNSSGSTFPMDAATVDSLAGSTAPLVGTADTIDAKFSLFNPVAFFFSWDMGWDMGGDFFFALLISSGGQIYPSSKEISAFATPASNASDFLTVQTRTP